MLPNLGYNVHFMALAWDEDAPKSVLHLSTFRLSHQWYSLASLPFSQLHAAAER